MTDTEYQEFERAFIAALLWSTPVDGEVVEKYFDAVADGIEDFTPESAAHIQQECKKFLEQAGELIRPGQYEQAGQDFALTLNGHGTGFWDRPEIYGKEKAAKLTALTNNFAEIHLYTNDGVTVEAE
jgi:calcineurin-like phosphoesterase